MATPTVLQWGALTVAGDNSSLYHLDSLSGWRGDLPPARIDSEPRPNAHGESDTPVWASARTVTLAGSCRTNSQRDALFAALTGATVYTGDAAPGTLTVQEAGLTLTAAARVIGATPSRVPGAWGVGQFGFQVMWRCADPLLYGGSASDTATMLGSTGGAVFPAFPGGVFSFGSLLTAKYCVLTNPGSMDSPVVFSFAVGANALTGGVRITELTTGRIVQYGDDLGANSTLVIDGSTGTALLNGSVDRTGSLSIRQFTPVAAGQTRSYGISGVSSSSSTIVLTGTMRPAYL